MDTRFDFKNEEQKIYEAWEKGGYFAPKETGEPFCIILPPPNANADLHLGHAMYVIEDIMVRYHRMKGDSVLWLPGADHAGFETQFVFEKHLAKQGKSRFDFDRETLFKNIWDFVQKNRVVMEDQLRRLGFSLDWSRKRFTLDPDIKKIVYTTFKKLYDAGLIYRGERVVDYCTKDGTSFSDLEVNHQEIEGKLYFIKYQLYEKNDEYITVATTRPETLLGDTAIAVHPKDERYKHLIGKHVIRPFLVNKNEGNVNLPEIISDPYAKQDFGTGAVKITPAHDKNDFEVYKRHSLNMISVIGENGRLNENVPQIFRGLRTYEVNGKIEAREKILEELEKLHLYSPQETIKHKMVIGKCYKCGRVLEFLPKRQWFLRVKPLAEKAIATIEEKEIKFYPRRYEQQATQWFKDFHDWNVSRQIVWGIRIPAWYCMSAKCVQRGIEKNEFSIEVTKDGEKPNVSCKNCNSSTDWVQDPDTFDTWFSSGQWPFATLQSLPKSIVETRHGASNENKSAIRSEVKSVTKTENAGETHGSCVSTENNSDYDRFYPTTVMETGYDILPWWVCRMIFLGIFATGKIPFKNVYLHGLVRDAKGQKMSKSKGNVVNPLEMVDKYGADALRASLLFGIGQGADVPFSEERVRAMRNFVTKIWNVGRFLMTSLDFHGLGKNDSHGTDKMDPQNQFSENPASEASMSIRENRSVDLPFYSPNMPGLQEDDKQIVKELDELIKSVMQNFESYEFSLAFNDIYEFTWHRFADWYIERVKERLKNGDKTALAVLRHTFFNCLKLLHPFMPFVTEALWGQMPRREKEMLIVSKWPS